MSNQHHPNNLIQKNVKISSIAMHYIIRVHLCNIFCKVYLTINFNVFNSSILLQTNRSMHQGGHFSSEVLDSIEKAKCYRENSISINVMQSSTLVPFNYDY